jgi:hypothetical protein
MANLVEQLRAYGGYLDELSPPPSPIGSAKNHSRRRIAFAAIAAVLVTAIAAVVLVAEDDAPGRLTTNAPSSTEAVSTTSVPAPEPAIVAENPTLDQQIARLESWYKNAPGDAPGGRPMLAAEYVFCDSGTTNSTVPVRGTFASNFPLGQPLTEARIAEACARSDSANTRTQLGTAFKLCATTVRGPRYDPAVTSIVPVTRPILAFGAISCATAGYPAAADGLLDSINALRNIEINLRAVPRDCPTEEEASAWVHKVTKTQLGQEWTIGSPASSLTPLTGCYRPFFIDRETRQVHLIASPRS